MHEQNRVAIVSGASRGIGRQVAIDLARAGFDIAFCYHKNQEQAAATSAEIQAAGRRVYAARCDVRDHDEVGQFVKAARAELGTVSLLVNNAGVVMDNPLALMTLAQWDEVIRTNLDSVFHFCRHVVFEFMKCKRGKIIHISSVAGIHGSPTQCNYSASKAAIIGFSSSLAKEVGPYNISVNVVAPGFIETDMTAQMDDRTRRAMLAKIPLGRFGGPRDVSALVSFLASDQADYITGQVFSVDGGIVI